MKKAISNKKEILYWLFLFLVISRLYPHLLPILTTYFRKKSFSALVEDKKPMSPALFRADQFESKTMEISQDIDKLQNKGSAELVEKILTKYGLHTSPEHAHNSAIKELIYSLLLNFLFYKRGLIYERSHKLSQAQADFSRITTNDKLDKFPRVKEFKGKEQAHIFKDWSSLHQLKNAAFMKSIYLEEDKEEFSNIFTRYEQHEGVMHQFETIHAFPLVAGGVSEEIEDCSSQEIYARSIFSQWKEYWSEARSVFGGSISEEKVFACFMANRELPDNVGSHDDDRGVDKEKGQTKKSQAGDDHARNQGKLWAKWAENNFGTINPDRLDKYEKIFKTIKKIEALRAAPKKQAKDKSRIHSPNTQEQNAKRKKEDSDRERYAGMRAYQQGTKSNKEYMEKQAQAEKESEAEFAKYEQERFKELRLESDLYWDEWRAKFGKEEEEEAEEDDENFGKELDKESEESDRGIRDFGDKSDDQISIQSTRKPKKSKKNKDIFSFWDETTDKSDESDEDNHDFGSNFQ